MSYLSAILHHGIDKNIKKWNMNSHTVLAHRISQSKVQSTILSMRLCIIYFSMRPDRMHAIALSRMPQQTCLTKLMSPCLYCCCSRLSMTWQCPSVFAQNKDLWWHNNESYENQKNKKISELVVLTSSYFSLLYITFHDECSKHSWNTTFERCNSRMHEIADNLDITKNTPADILVPFNNRLSYSCFCSGC